MFSLGLIIVIILLALSFDFINGFHDTANAIATSVSTKALSPRNAILVATSLNFIGALSGTAVAATIGKSIVAPDLVSPVVMIAALVGAIFWNLFTWYFGIPSSSSHALIGGLIGAVIAGFGFNAVLWAGFLENIRWIDYCTHSGRRGRKHCYDPAVLVFPSCFTGSDQQ